MLENSKPLNIVESNLKNEKNTKLSSGNTWKANEWALKIELNLLNYLPHIQEILQKMYPRMMYFLWCSFPNDSFVRTKQSKRNPAHPSSSAEIEGTLYFSILLLLESHFSACLKNWLGILKVIIIRGVFDVCEINF